MTQIVIPLNVVIFFGIPITYDMIIKRRPPSVFGFQVHNLRKSFLLGVFISLVTFPLAYIIFKIVFSFSTKELVQPGTVAYYFYIEFAYPFNIIYYSIWTILVISLGEELFFRGFIHKKLEQKLHFLKAALISSSIFSIAHILSITLFPLPMMLTYIGLIFIFSFLLAFTLHFTGNLVGCWVSHGISNILAAIFIGIL